MHLSLFRGCDSFFLTRAPISVWGRCTYFCLGSTPISAQESAPTSVWEVHLLLFGRCTYFYLRELTSIRGAATTSVPRGEPTYFRVEAPNSVWGGAPISAQEMQLYLFGRCTYCCLWRFTYFLSGRCTHFCSGSCIYFCFGRCTYFCSSRCTYFFSWKCTYSCFGGAPISLRGAATLGCAPTSLRKRAPTFVRGGAILASATTVVGGGALTSVWEVHLLQYFCLGGAPTSASERCTYFCSGNGMPTSLRKRAPNLFGSTSNME